MSVQHWGEDPTGTWRLNMSLIQDQAETGSYADVLGQGVVKHHYAALNATLLCDAIYAVLN